jgi:hypothetical protein
MAQKQEAYPLYWPDGWVRTRIQDRKAQSSWKKSLNDYREDLIKELERMGTKTLVISCNIPLTLRGTLTAGMQPLDPGVAVYFRREKKEDYSWQEVLGINDPAPSEEAIDSAFRKLAAKYHPDQGGDPEMFKTLVRHRDSARAYIRQSSQFDYVIACDLFKEVRLNINAIRLTVAAIRQIERCGASSLLERAFSGFKSLGEGDNGTTAA